MAPRTVHTLTAPGHEDEVAGLSGPEWGDTSSGFPEAPDPMSLVEEDPIALPIPQLDIELPAGIRFADNEWRTLTVRELTGMDEERLAKVKPASVQDYMTELLKIGIQMIGGTPVAQLPMPLIIDQMLVGDRDAALLGLRRATYGSDLEIKGLTCPECSEDFDVLIDLEEEIPVRKLEAGGDRYVTVPTRRMGDCNLRFVTHGDMVELSKKQRTGPEQDTVLLSRTLVAVKGKSVAELPYETEDLVRNLGSADREAMITALTEAQPGPDLREVKVECPGCGLSAPAGLTLANLFRS